MSITPEAPQSRVESWLSAIAGLSEDVPTEVLSRIEQWLKYIKENGTERSLPEIEASDVAKILTVGTDLKAKWEVAGSSATIVMIDQTTGTQYGFGMNNGQFFVEEVIGNE